jgi:formamidopyrimidine-DNA glycosylase
MPELPEVETTRRHLAPVIVGARVEAVEVRRDRMVRRQENPADFSARLTGRTVRSLDRHGKFMLARLDGDLTWVTHLGMSGRIQISDRLEPVETHANVLIDLASGPQIRFVDPRTFGFMNVFTPDEFAASSIAALGPDALDELPRSRVLADMLGRRAAPIKAILLDQRFVAGLGNIYADEVLFRAGVSPHRSGASLTSDEVQAVRAAIRPILKAGLDAGGTSLDDLAYLLPDGRAGDYMARLNVYGRHGMDCNRCGTPVTSTVLRGRTTHWCAGCQK